MSEPIGLQEEKFAVFLEGEITYLEDVCAAALAYLETDTSHAGTMSVLALREIRKNLQKCMIYNGMELFIT